MSSSSTGFGRERIHSPGGLDRPFCKLSPFHKHSGLTLLQLSGFWVLLLLGRWSMVRGWIDLIKRWKSRHHEFVSADAQKLSDESRAYELLDSAKSPQNSLRSPEPVATSPNSLSISQMSPYVDQKIDYFGREAKYTSPSTSFSSPRPPSANGVWGQDRMTTFSSLGYPQEVKE